MVVPLEENLQFGEKIKVSVFRERNFQRQGVEVVHCRDFDLEVLIFLK
jgi:hypothetical protein